MENAITAVALDDHTAAVTSSGQQMDNTVAGYTVRLFSRGKCISAGIAANLHFIGFVTGGNDGKLVAYDCEGVPRFRCETAPDVIT